MDKEPERSYEIAITIIVIILLCAPADLVMITDDIYWAILAASLILVAVK